MKGILGDRALEEINAVGFLKSRSAHREPGRSVLEPAELYDLLLNSLGLDACDALTSVFFDLGEREMCFGSGCINERTRLIPRQVLLILATDLFMVLRDREPGISPTRILDLCLRRTRLAAALSELFGLVGIRTEAINGPDEIREGDVLLLVSFCYDPDRLRLLAPLLSPINDGFAICEHIASVIGPPPGRGPQVVCCCSPEAQGPGRDSLAGGSVNPVFDAQQTMQ